MTLTQLIKQNKFDYVNSDITKSNFPLEPIRSTNYKLYHFDQYISSDDAIKEIEKAGYSPANIYELLSWKEWNGNNYVVGLGSSCKVCDDVLVPILFSDHSKRYLSLFWRDGDWGAHCRFLAVRTSSLDTQKPELSISGALTLEQRMSALEQTLADIKSLL